MARCDFCRDNESDKTWEAGGSHEFRISQGCLYYYDEQTGWEGINIKYCPMCGRKIELKPKAKWIKSEWGYPDRTLTCSLCGYAYDSADYNNPKFKQKVLPYCPNCGEKMDLEV